MQGSNHQSQVSNQGKDELKPEKRSEKRKSIIKRKNSDLDWEISAIEDPLKKFGGGPDSKNNTKRNEFKSSKEQYFRKSKRDENSFRTSRNKNFDTTDKSEEKGLVLPAISSRHNDAEVPPLLKHKYAMSNMMNNKNINSLGNNANGQGPAPIEHESLFDIANRKKNNPLSMNILNNLPHRQEDDLYAPKMSKQPYASNDMLRKGQKYLGNPNPELSGISSTINLGKNNNNISNNNNNNNNNNSLLPGLSNRNAYIINKYGNPGNSNHSMPPLGSNFGMGGLNPYIMVGKNFARNGLDNYAPPIQGKYKYN